MKLGDFETAQKLDTSNGVDKGLITGYSQPFMSPEYFDPETKALDLKSDIYPFGICIIQLVFTPSYYNILLQQERASCRGEGYDAQRFYREFNHVENASCNGPPLILNELFNLARRCISPESGSRPSAQMLKVEMKAIFERIRSF